MDIDRKTIQDAFKALTEAIEEQCSVCPSYNLTTHQCVEHYKCFVTRWRDTCKRLRAEIERATKGAK